MSRAGRARWAGWSSLRLAGGAAVLAVVVWQLGSAPILDGLRTVSVPAVMAASGIVLVTTVCSAWRWRLVARGLGAQLPLRTAIAAYYRSQFLNTALPGGVLGDVHRAVRHGRAVGDVGRGLRAVAWERSAGQVVQLAVALVVLTILPSPVRSSLPIAIAALLAGAFAAVALLRALPAGGPSRWARVVRAAATDVRDGLLSRRALPGVVLASVLVVAGHTATFLIAARTAGSTASVTTLLPLAMLVLLAMAVPMNLGGWGPREGVAAWVFAAAGLGADRGLAAATVYGVLVVMTSLPGAAVLLVARHRHRTRPATPAAQPPAARPISAPLAGALRG